MNGPGSEAAGDPEVAVAMQPRARRSPGLPALRTRCERTGAVWGAARRRRAGDRLPRPAGPRDRHCANHRGAANAGWADLAGRSGDATGLYSVSRVPGAGFVNQVSRIDTGTAAFSDLYSFTASDFGFGPTFGLDLLGISIAPGQSSIAIINAAFTDLTFQQGPFDGIFELDLDTGVASGLQLLSGTPPRLLSDLSHAPGGTLFGVLGGFPPPPIIGMVDPVNGVISPIGGPSTFELRALAFDPATGELLSTSGASTLALPGFIGSLFEISPTTGELLEIRGSVGLEGSINALAFVIPEPDTGLLVMIGLSLLGARRRQIH
jgi:hypothetical protein